MFKQFLGVMLSLLLAVLAAMALPVSAQTAKARAPASNAVAVAVGDVGRSVSQAPDQEAKDQIKELAAELKSMQAAVLEGQRKSIDWWMTAIGIVLTFIGLLAAVVGILIPMYVNREKNRLLKAAQDEFARMNAEATNILETLKSHEKDGANSAAAGKTASEQIEQLRLTMNAVVPGDIPNTSEPNAVATKTLLAATQIEKSPLATREDKLRARAILAGQKTPRSAGQAQTAYELWAALALLNEQDDRAHASAGYWALVLYELKAQPGAAYWLQATYKHYAQALNANPEKHEAAYNWGNALLAEANALFGEDLPLAQAKWREAGEKFAQALHIKPENHEAAYNWGICLLAEAQALLNKQAPDEAAASQCLTQAAQLLEKQAAMGQEGQEAVALTLAGTYSMQRRLNEALVQLEIARKANDLPASWQTSPTLKNLRAASEYQTWLNQHFPKKD